VIVVQRRWITESELAELYGLAQAVAGLGRGERCVLLGPRYASVLGVRSSL